MSSLSYAMELDGPSAVLVFGDFVLDRRQRVLFRNGQVVKMTPKAFDLLDVLSARPAEVVSKAELMDALWPDTHVDEANLSKLVFVLRKELGTTRDGRDYVETVPKRGYRFIAEVGQRSSPTIIAAAPEAAPAKRSLTPGFNRGLLAIAALLVIAAGVLTWTLRARRTAHERPYLVVMPFTATSPADEALARGIGEFVTSRLSTIRGLGVMPAVMSNADKTDDRTLARNLGASLVLRGVVQRTGERVRISYSVLSVDQKLQIGSASFDDTQSDMFDLEDRVAASVASLLEIEQSLQREADPALTTPQRQQTYMRAVGLLTKSGEGPRSSEAIEMLQSLNSGTPSPLVLAALGRAHLERFRSARKPDDLTAAEACASRAATLTQGHPRVRALLGSIYRARGDPKKASTELQAALELEPDANDILLELAEVYADMGRKEKAQQTYDYVLQIHPECAVCVDDYGAYYASHGKPETAVPLYERAIALEPDNPRFRSHLAVALMKLGRYGDAIPVLQAGIRIRPTGSALTNLGYCEYLLGRFSDAARHFADATAILPEDFSLWGNLGDALRLVPERHADAKAAFERAIALSRRELQVNPNEARIHAMLGEYLAKHGDIAEADRELTAALALQPDSDDVLVSAAAIAAIEGKKSDAVDYMRRATAVGLSPSLFGNDPQFHSLRSEPKFVAYLAGK